MSIYESGAYWNEVPDLHESDSDGKAEKAMQLVGSLPIKSILDVGCGSGRVLSLLCEHLKADEGLGLDLSEESVGYARSKYGSDVVSFSTQHLETVDRVFDLVLLLDVFEHVDDYIGLLRQLRNKGRRFVFSIPLDMNVLSILRSSYMKARSRIGHLHYFTKESALATLEYSGYRVVDCRYADPGIAGLWQKRKFASVAAHLPRRAVSMFSRDVSARLFGGNGIFVLATPQE